jgi:hypothetical protein
VLAGEPARHSICPRRMTPSKTRNSSNTLLT